MSDFKLFQLGTGAATEITGGGAQIEKSLQILFETNLDPLLGVRFLTSEYKTGSAHGGRIDTLGLDENGYPVIIEFKRALNENVINQGLFYLDWLMDHHGDFEMLVLNRLGPNDLKQIDWSAPRLVCVAADFTNYDMYAVRQIHRNIDLVRYRYYGNHLLLLQLAHTSSVVGDVDGGTGGKGSGTGHSLDVAQILDQAPQHVKDLFEALKAYLIALGDDVQVKQLKNYFAFRRIKNFACVQVFAQSEKIVVYLKCNPSSIEPIPSVTRDVTNVGHYGTGDLEVTLKTMQDFDKTQSLLLKSYEVS